MFASEVTKTYHILYSSTNTCPMCFIHVECSETIYDVCAVVRSVTLELWPLVFQLLIIRNRQELYTELTYN